MYIYTLLFIIIDSKITIDKRYILSIILLGILRGIYIPYEEFSKVKR